MPDAVPRTTDGFIGNGARTQTGKPERPETHPQGLSGRCRSGTSVPRGGDRPAASPSQAEAPRAYRDADEPVTEPTPPQAAQVAQTSSHGGYVPTVPVAAPERLAARDRRAGTQRFGDPAIQNPPRRLRGSQPAWTVRDSDVPAGPPTAPPAGGFRRVGFSHPTGTASFADSPAGVPRRRARPSGSSERRLRWAIGIATGVLVLMVAALVATANGSDRQPDSQVTATTGSPGPANSRVQSGPTGAPSGHGGVSFTPTSTALAKPGGAPTLSALAPASGHAGQTVTVTGSNFLSSSGQISVQIGGQMAPVTCPDQTTCTVVIPPDPGSTSSASVTITTDSGTSNTLIFTYESLGAPAVTSMVGRPSPGLLRYGARQRSGRIGGGPTRSRER